MTSLRVALLPAALFTVLLGACSTDPNAPPRDRDEVSSVTGSHLPHRHPEDVQTISTDAIANRTPGAPKGGGN